MNLMALILAAFLLLAAAGWSSADNSVRDLTVGKMCVNFSPKSGLSISYGGVSITKESTLWVHNANWSAHYYGYPEGKIDATTKDIPGGKEALIRHESSSFQGQHRITVLPDKVSIEFTYKLTANVDGNMEYNLGYVSASPIAGRAFEAVTADGTVSGTVPVIAKSPDMRQSLLTPKPFRKLSVDSRIGKLTIEVSGDPAELSIFDARKNRQPWATRNPVFWCGTLGKDLEVGKEYVQTVTIQVDPGIEREKPVNVGAGGDIFPKDVDSLRVPAACSVVVIPEPKEMKLLAGDFQLTPETKLVVADSAAPEDRYGAECFADEVEELYHIKLGIVPESKAPAGGVILIGEAAKNKALARAAAEEKLSAPDREEGYAVQVSPERVLVLGHDQRGSYWGMQTLRQLVKATAAGIWVQACQINDWPSLKFRGAHLFIGKDALPFHRKLYDRIFSRYKLNAVVLESEYLKWKDHPEIYMPFSMERADLEKDIADARKHFMEVIPMVNTMGHSEWMFHSLGTKPPEWKNLDLAEDKSHPYAYCASNPKTYDFIFKIYDEALEIFKPRYFHIGHDEITNAGEFPKDAECKKKSLGDLMIGDIKKLHDYLSKKGVKVMMWGDMFLAPGESPDACNAGTLDEARRRRSQLPKDIVFNDWHYAPADPDEFKSLKVLQDEGFRSIAATWYTPANIASFAQAAKDSNADGLLQTTWAGFDSNEGNLTASFSQFTAFILAAEYAWNTGQTALEDLPYKPDEEFRRQWDRIPPDCTPRKGFTIDLGPLYNQALADNQELTGWLGLGPENDLSAAPTGQERLKGDIFQLAKKTDELSVIRLSSAMDSDIGYPRSAEFPILRRASALVFLQTCAWPDSPGKTIGSYKVHYNDDTTAEIPLVYGDNTAAWNDNRTCPKSDAAWAGHTKSGQKVSLRRLEWKNPNPEKLITKVEFQSANTEAGPCLLAVSGVSAE